MRVYTEPQLEFGGHTVQLSAENTVPRPLQEGICEGSLSIGNLERRASFRALAAGTGTMVHSTKLNQMNVDSMGDNGSRSCPPLRKVLSVENESNIEFPILVEEIGALQSLLTKEFPPINENLSVLQRTNRLFQLLRLKSQDRLIDEDGNEFILMQKIWEGLEKCSQNGLTEYFEAIGVDTLGIQTQMGRMITRSLDLEMLNIFISDTDLKDLIHEYLSDYQFYKNSNCTNGQRERELAREISHKFGQYVSSSSFESEKRRFEEIVGNSPENLNRDLSPTYEDLNGRVDWNEALRSKPDNSIHGIEVKESPQERVENFLHSISFLESFYRSTKKEANQMALLNMLFIENSNFQIFDSYTHETATEKTLTTRSEWMTNVKEVKEASQRALDFYKIHYFELENPEDTVFWDIINYEIPIFNHSKIVEKLVGNVEDQQQRIIEIFKCPREEFIRFLGEYELDEFTKELLLASHDMYLLSTNLSAYLHIEAKGIDIVTALMSRPDYIKIDGIEVEEVKLGPLRARDGVYDRIVDSLESIGSTSLEKDVQRNSIYHSFLELQSAKKDLVLAQRMIIDFVLMDIDLEGKGIKELSAMMREVLLQEDENERERRYNTIEFRVLSYYPDKAIVVSEIMKKYRYISEVVKNKTSYCKESIDLRRDSVCKRIPKLEPTASITIGDIKTGSLQGESREKALKTQRRRLLLVVLSIYSASRKPGEDFLDWSLREDNEVVKAMFAGEFDLKSNIVKLFGSSHNMGLVTQPDSIFYSNKDFNPWLNESFYPELIVHSTTDPGYLVSIFLELENMYQDLKQKLIEKRYEMNEDGIEIAEDD